MNEPKALTEATKERLRQQVACKAPEAWTSERVKDLLERSDKAVGRALVAILKQQTSEEQATDTTVDLNGRGFNAFAAEIGSSLARWYRDKGYLTPKQMVVGRKVALKHVRQLVKIANGELR